MDISLILVPVAALSFLLGAVCGLYMKFNDESR